MAAPSAYHRIEVLSGFTFQAPSLSVSVLSTFATPLMSGGVVLARAPGSTAAVAAEVAALVAKPVLLAVVRTLMLLPRSAPVRASFDLVALAMATPLAYHW